MVARNIVFLRKHKSLTQAEICDSLGFIRNTWSNWENDISEPDIKTLQKIAHFFDVGISELIESDLSESGQVIKASPKTTKKAKPESKPKNSQEKSKEPFYYTAAPTSALLKESGGTYMTSTKDNEMVRNLASVIQQQAEEIKALRSALQQATTTIQQLKKQAK